MFHDRYGNVGRDRQVFEAVIRQSPANSPVLAEVNPINDLEPAARPAAWRAHPVYALALDLLREELPHIAEITDDVVLWKEVAFFFSNQCHGGSHKAAAESQIANFLMWGWIPQQVTFYEAARNYLAADEIGERSCMLSDGSGYRRPGWASPRVERLSIQIEAKS